MCRVPHHMVTIQEIFVLFSQFLVIFVFFQSLPSFPDNGGEIHLFPTLLGWH